MVQQKMGATLSVFTPTGGSNLSAPTKVASVFSYQSLPSSKAVQDTTGAARNMIAQHFHIMNTNTLKKLISSGALSRAKRNSKARILPEDLVLKRADSEKVIERTHQIAQEDLSRITRESDNKENVKADTADVKEEVPRIVKRTVLQASTSELLRCFGIFLHGRFRNLNGDFSPQDPPLWLRGLDRNLIAQGWQDIGFINPANIVFLYLLLRDLRMEHAKSIRQLQAHVLTALYLSYSYMGHEISYPVKLFLYADENKDDFWKRCLHMIDVHSANMLRLNSDSGYFAKIFAELKSFGAIKPVQYVL
ncbi:cyclin-dependent kinase 5 activator 1-like [Paramacrobiotus metropolitanus]|uniref:cyclin-dependent kinase 5 activator 1-like n=1 Tax=Paramacrobiotus metropolitanus TaxID=2943436 RepID=UPI002445DF15|nr:cyclin-dependent kinase 5 activator 1-like [Paramacrobiotus metropolitanus]